MAQDPYRKLVNAVFKGIEAALLVVLPFARLCVAGAHKSAASDSLISTSNYYFGEEC